MAKTYCPDCDAVIQVEDPEMGQSVHCRDCGAELEVISVNPFEVDFPLDYDQDWDDDDDE